MQLLFISSRFYNVFIRRGVEIDIIFRSLYDKQVLNNIAFHIMISEYLTYREFKCRLPTENLNVEFFFSI